MADEERYNELRRKFHPVLLEMDRQGVRLDVLEMRNEKLYMRAEAPSKDAANYVWKQIRFVDQDLVDLTAEISIGEGAKPGDRKAADVEIQRTAAPNKDTVQQGGDRGAGYGIV